MDKELLIIALTILVPAALLWAILLYRTGKPGKPKLVIGIPPAMRPGEPDEKLEGPRLERILVGGVASVTISAVLIAGYWFPERDRHENFQERFDEESVERGEIIFKPAAQIPEDIAAADFKEVEKSVALGMGCANCHGADGVGGIAIFTEPISGEKVAWTAPPLNNVFQRWDEEVVRHTIERGRPGTPMPTWGVDFGGPMTSQMVSDVIAYLKTLPGNQEPPKPFSDACSDLPKEGSVECGAEIFEARCAVCHGPEGQGKEDKTLIEPDTTTRRIVDDELPVWYQGLALWKGDVRHLRFEQHFATVTNGRRFAFMPPWGEAPSQGIPVPAYPLTNKEIRSVVLYERSL
jgi:mono/diheme cytochrome c family protein